MLDPAAIYAESKRRRAVLSAPYDPYYGTGSPLERFVLPLGDNKFGQHIDLHLPVAMLDGVEGLEAVVESGLTLRQACADANCDFGGELLRLNLHRLDYDFEFWSASIAKIKAGRGFIYPDGRKIAPGTRTEFWLNRPQRQFLAKLERQRLAGLPVRAIVLKHRQWGATTFSFTYIAWHQMALYRDRDAWFIGLDSDGAADVLARYDEVRMGYNEMMPTPLSIRPHHGSQNTRIMPERGCTVSAGSVNNPNAPSGRTPQFVHAFEMGKWPSTNKVSAERVMQNVSSMLVDAPGTVGIIESTAQGATGPFFKELCEQAQNEESNYEFIFVSTLGDPQYQIDISTSEVDSFVKSFNERDILLWQRGACLEQIKWFREKAKEPVYLVKPWMVLEEFPTTKEEAFTFGEKPVFPKVYVATLRKTCREPLARGELYAEALTGEGALKGLRFEKSERGSLSIWRWPGDDYNGRMAPPEGFQIPLSNRYAAGSDVGGQWTGADFSVHTMLDRAPRLWHAWPEVVAEWHGHEDPTLFAWICARVCYFYGQTQARATEIRRPGAETNGQGDPISAIDPAYWIPEVNSFQAKKRSALDDDSQTPNYGQTVIQEIKGVFPSSRMYFRKKLDRVGHERSRLAGWWTDQYNKPEAVQSLLRAMKGFYDWEVEEIEGDGHGYIERSKEACGEMDSFLHVEGRMEASPKKKDDRVMTRALVLFADQQVLPPPSFAPIYVKRKTFVSAAKL